MEVNVSQLVPGCILQKDVIGKTGKPIVGKQTVLTEKHIKFLEKFLIKKVVVVNQLAYGRSLTQDLSIQKIKDEKSSFLNQVRNFLVYFEGQFQTWKEKQQIDTQSLQRRMNELFANLRVE